MTRRAVSFVAGALLLTVACAATPPSTSSASSSVTCYRPTKVQGATATCDCENKASSRSAADFTKVAMCDDPSAFCCSNVDTNGEATTCSCYEPRCFRDDAIGMCACGNGYNAGFNLDVRDALEVKSCDDISGVRCCASPGAGCWCSADLDPDDCKGGVDARPVTTCRASQFVPKECAGETLTRSCAEVTFKPPPPPSSSSSSGGSKDECKNDGDCSSDCLTDCYGCRSGSCKCGRRGVSGGCLL
ncbi:MAG: hypothetical protein KF894_29345 [Labilithrix sp.]|nr:hypothetical protein [Labilithrix sp.]